MSHPRLLILDDDAHLQEALGVWFAKRNYEVKMASDGEDGLQILRQDPSIEMVLADFMMPGLNGIELLKVLKASSELNHLKVLLMSHNEKPEFRSRALQLGAVDYLSKGDGAKLIVERAIAVLEDAPPDRPAVADSELRLMSESLVSLLRITSLTEGLPASAVAGLKSAGALAERMDAALRS